jgi:hypothetical protein
MNFRLGGLVFAFLALSITSASAGYWKYKAMNGKVMNYVGCGRQEHVVRQMKKHPELYGQPSASLVAAQTTRKRPELWNKPQGSMASLKSQ